MSIRTLAASVLALGLLAPIGAIAAETNYNCSQDQANKLEYIDCKADNVTQSTQGFSAAAVGGVERQSIGDYVDESAAERNQRSSN
jgi:hypothetical protein